MARRLRVLADSLRANFFVLPAAAVLVAFLGGRLAVGVEAGEWVGDATVDSARSVLSTVAAATITFASIAFSVSLLIMQQGSTQFSPRVIHSLTRDPFNRRVIALVAATFTYCLVVLQRVRGPLEAGGESVAPRFAVALGLVLGVGAVLAVVAVIHHTARQMDVSNILDAILHDARRTPATPIGTLRRSPDLPHPPADVGDVVRFDTTGWVRQIDRAGLLAATPPGSFVRLETQPGRYAIRTAALCTIWPPPAADQLQVVGDEIRRAVAVGPTRTMTDDGGYALRQVVDIALRALSPGVNDPTTAQDAIFHLGSLLAERFAAPPVPRSYTDDEGRCLAEPHAMSDDELAELALSELRVAAAGLPAVSVYLMEMVAEVIEVARHSGAAERVQPLLDQMRFLDDAIDTSIADAHDRRRLHSAYNERFGVAAIAESPAG